MFTLQIEKVTDADVESEVELVRGIVFETDPETGYKSIVDIAEMPREGAEHMLAAIAGNFDNCFLAYENTFRTNFGRATSMRTMIRKIVEQLP